MQQEKRDTIFVLSAYTSWGLLPLYWKLLSEAPAPTILGHRVFWSVVVLGVTLAVRGKLKQSLLALCNLKKLPRICLSATFIAVNWLVYVWAMGHGYIIEAGLGYFICPIFSLVLSAAILNESLSPQKALAVAVTVVGVLIKVIGLGSMPWVALALAASFSFYIAARKTVAGDPVESLFQEALLALPVIVVFISIFEPDSLWTGYNLNTKTLLVLSGPITAIPLLLLTQGLRSVPLQTSAMMQYIAPTLTIAMGLVSGEKLTAIDALALPVIWFGVLLYAAGERLPWSRLQIRRT